MRRWFGVLFCLGLDPVCKLVLIRLMLHKESFVIGTIPRLKLTQQLCMLTAVQCTDGHTHTHGQIAGPKAYAGAM